MRLSTPTVAHTHLAAHLSILGLGANQLKSEDINFIRGTAEFCRHPSCLNVNPTRESLSIHHVILGILLYNLLMNMDSNKTLLMAKI